LFLWVSPVDEDQTPVDPVFLDAAYRIGADFLFYRARELNDHGLALELAEKAVHRASRARKTQPVREPRAYLFRTFTNLVDEQIRRCRRFLPLTEQVIQHVTERIGPLPEQDFEREVDWKQILESLDQTTRWVLERLRRGYTIQEIAREMGIRPNTLSQRIHRARKELRNTLDHGRGKARTSKGDVQRKPGRTPPRRNLPPHGANGPA
jgi:RNA polymerase sigma factor (sigma-70 family)